MLDGMMERLGTEQVWMAAEGSNASCYDLVDTGEILLCTDAAGGVALRVEIDKENLLAGFCQVSAEVDSRGGLPDSSLLVCKNYDLCHRPQEYSFSPLLTI